MTGNTKSWQGQEVEQNSHKTTLENDSAVSTKDDYHMPQKFHS